MGITAAVIGAIAAVGTGAAQTINAKNTADDQKKEAARKTAEQQALLKKQKDDERVIKEKTKQRDAELIKTGRKEGEQAGFGGTKLTSPLGVPQTAGNTYAKTLLGL